MKCAKEVVRTLDDRINIKSYNPNEIQRKPIEKSHKNIVTYYISYETINSANLLYLIVNEINI